MADTKQKKKLMVTPVGVALYPKLTAPDRKFSNNGIGKYKVRLLLDPVDPVVQKFIEDGKAWFEEQRTEWLETNKKYAKTAKPKAEGFRDQIDEEGETTGKVFISCSMNESFKDTKTNKTVIMKPDIRDSLGRVCKPAQIWGGSKMRLALQLGFYTQGAEYTESWRLLGVQIIELVKGQAGGDMFGAFGGGYSSADDEDEAEEAEEAEEVAEDSADKEDF